VGCKGGKTLPLRFGQSGAAREMNLVQIVVEAPAIRGVCQALGRHSLFLASPRYELGKVAFSSMFLKRKKSQRFGF